MKQHIGSCYFVKCQVNNGRRQFVRSAVAFADNPESAVDKVNQFVQNRDGASYVEKVLICQRIY